MTQDAQSAEDNFSTGWPQGLREVLGLGVASACSSAALHSSYSLMLACHHVSCKKKTTQEHSRHGKTLAIQNTLDTSGKMLQVF